MFSLISDHLFLSAYLLERTSIKWHKVNLVDGRNSIQFVLLF